MKRIFVIFLCASITYLAAADEAADVKELIEKAVHDHAGSEEMAQHIRSRLKIIQDCTSKHPEEETALLKKMVLPVATDGTKCASTHTNIPDHAEKWLAVKKCFRETDKRVKETAGLSDKETVAYDAVKTCFYAGLKELDA